MAAIPVPSSNSAACRRRSAPGPSPPWCRDSTRWAGPGTSNAAPGSTGERSSVPPLRRRGWLDRTDLTGSVYSREDLLRSLIEPSHSISDQYGQTAVNRTDGSRVVGRVVGLSEDTVEVNTNPADADRERLQRGRVDESVATSAMPERLLDVPRRRRSSTSGPTSRADATRPPTDPERNTWNSTSRSIPAPLDASGRSAAGRRRRDRTVPRRS